MENSTNSSFSKLKKFINMPKVKFPLILGFFILYPYIQLFDEFLLCERVVGTIEKSKTTIYTSRSAYTAEEYYVNFTFLNANYSSRLGENLYLDPSGEIPVLVSVNDANEISEVQGVCFGALYQGYPFIILLGGIIVTSAVWWMTVSVKD